MKGAILETVSVAGSYRPRKNDFGYVGTGSLGTSPGVCPTWLSLRHLSAPEGGRAIHSSLCLECIATTSPFGRLLLAPRPGCS